MSDSTEFLTQIFYGTDVWGYLGPLAIICFGLILIVVTKYTAIFSATVLSIMGVDYFDKITPAGYYTWHAVLCLFGAIFIALLAVIVGDKKR